MSKRTVIGGIVVVAFTILSLWYVKFGSEGASKKRFAQRILTSYSPGTQGRKLTMITPCDRTLFPPDIAPVSFMWDDRESGADAWLLLFDFEDPEQRVYDLSDKQSWTPEEEQWKTIKKNALSKYAKLTIAGVKRRDPETILSRCIISFATSEDAVGAPIFYREVNLPFVDAVKDPSNIRWRFGSVSSPGKPPVILEKLPVCGNCHSFPRDAKELAMDVDYANSKGSYVITSVDKNMTLSPADIITWNDYKREDGEQTFGLLSQISPDGKMVVSTVKDKSVFVPKPDLAFSQLFFPLKGILAVYYRGSKSFKSLPGADDPEYVQSNPSWSPDGKYIVFARAKAYDLKTTSGKGKVLLTREECKEFVKDGRPFLFDLYRIPFNDGRGGTPEPLKGASNNGMSNYFARYSPDGKWIVFCRAKSYMLLQPDSELYIIPAEGGTARRLACNTKRMNSWHSWSPNGRWLVFSSKAHSPYTQLFLTHIDEKGQSSPPLLLSNFTSSDRAANIPEFVNVRPDAITKIKEDFLNDYSFERAGNEFFRAGDADNAISEYRKALKLNPENVVALQRLGFLLLNVTKQKKQALQHLEKAVQLAPNDPTIHYDYGFAAMQNERYEKAIHHMTLALNRLPKGYGRQYRPAEMHYFLARTLSCTDRCAEAEKHFNAAVQCNCRDCRSYYMLALLQAPRGEVKSAIHNYKKAVAINPGIDTNPLLHDSIAVQLSRRGRFEEAVMYAKRACQLAVQRGNAGMAKQLKKKLELYRMGKSL